MKTIGVIGGSTDLATVEYYKLINTFVREELGGLHTGEIIINSMDLANSARYVHGELWEEGAEYLSKKAQSLERAGADFIICVSNTWHRVADEFMRDVKIPLLHIVDPTANEIRRLGLKKVALLGTKATMSGPYLPGQYSRRFGIDIIVPDEDDQTYIDKVIFDEISYNVFKDEARIRYLDVVDKMTAQGAEGIILGCTEIPLLISQNDRPAVPFFDTLRLHAKAATTKAIYE